MKTRNGFVSNSSSSSFIVAIKPENTSKVHLDIEVDLKDYGDIIKDKAELLEYVRDNFGCATESKVLADEWYSETYKEMLSEIEKGNHVIAGSFSSEGDPLNAFLYENGFKNVKNDNITIIQDGN